MTSPQERRTDTGLLYGLNGLAHIKGRCAFLLTVAAVLTWAKAPAITDATATAATIVIFDFTDSLRSSDIDDECRHDGNEPSLCGVGPMPDAFLAAHNVS